MKVIQLMETLLHPTGSELECTPSNWFFQETDCFQINSFSQLNDELIQEILKILKRNTKLLELNALDMQKYLGYYVMQNLCRLVLQLQQIKRCHAI